MSPENVNDLKLFITGALQQQDLRWHNELVQLGMDLRVEMQQGYRKLDEKIDRVYKELDEKIDRVYKELDEKITKLDIKIDWVHDKLDNKINQVHDKLDAKIDHLANTVFDALDAYHGDHEQRIQKLEAKPA